MMDAALVGLRASAIEMQHRAMLQKYECEVQLYAAKVKMAQITGIHGARMGKPAPSKCPGCGSHEWRQHNSVRICAYCRCGDGSTVSVTRPDDEGAYARMSDKEVQRYLRRA